jgi:glycerophosphoryl diester phosphodiesterase
MGAPKIVRQIWPVIVAHRGASATHPENTLESFDAAVGAGADLVEFDVRMTSDGVAVVMHDADVSRRTDGSGFVHELTLAELKRLDASGGRGPRAEVPTLHEVLELLSGRVGVDIEIKNLPGEPGFESPVESAADATLRELERASFDGEVLVTSFNWLSIEHVKAVRPDVPTGFLSTAAIDPRAALVYARAKGHEFVLPQAAAVVEAGDGFLADAHAEGVRVGTWTVDDPEEMRRLFDLGVDAVATNDPVAGAPVRDARRAAAAAAGAQTSTDSAPGTDSTTT